MESETSLTIANQQDEASTPASFQHHRRSGTTGGNGNGRAKNSSTMWNNNDCHWSVDARSKYTFQHFIDRKVAEGIKKAATELRLTLHASDESWLAQHDGRFEMFSHPASPESKKQIESKSNRGKSLNAINQKMVERNHKHLEASPRFIGSPKSPTYQNNIETEMRNFWNFLAIIGDYQSMLVLLVHPSQGCPAVHVVLDL
jgi:hypothetical protein